MCRSRSGLRKVKRDDARTLMQDSGISVFHIMSRDLILHWVDMAAGR